MEKTFDIITVGSASVDVLVKTDGEVINHKKNDKIHQDIAYHLGDKLLIDDLLFTTGGGGTNTAVAFSRLGLKTAYIGVLGSDMNAEIIAKELKNEGVEFLGKVKSGKTGFSIILPGKNDRAILNYRGVNNSLQFSDIPLPLDTKWVYISSMLGDSFDAVEKLAITANKEGIKIALNISLYLAKLGLKKLEKIIRSTDILILNKEEAANLTDKANVKQMLETLAEYMNGIVVITNSANPVHALTGKIIYTKHIKEVKVVDKTGAGDAFAAGFVYSIIQGKGIEEAIEFGHKEALSVMSHVGAKNNLLRK